MCSRLTKVTPETFHMGQADRRISRITLSFGLVMGCMAIIIVALGSALVVAQLRLNQEKQEGLASYTFTFQKQVQGLQKSSDNNNSESKHSKSEDGGGLRWGFQSMWRQWLRNFYMRLYKCHKCPVLCGLGPSGHSKVCGRQKAADISVMPIAEGASWALGSQPTREN